MVKNPPANAGESGSIPGLGRSPRGGNGNPLQYSCLENSTDRRAWWVTVHGAAKSQTQLSNQAHASSRGARGWDPQWSFSTLPANLNCVHNNPNSFHPTKHQILKQGEGEGIWWNRNHRSSHWLLFHERPWWRPLMPRWRQLLQTSWLTLEPTWVHCSQGKKGNPERVYRITLPEKQASFQYEISRRENLGF